MTCRCHVDQYSGTISVYVDCGTREHISHGFGAPHVTQLANDDPAVDNEWAVEPTWGLYEPGATYGDADSHHLSIDQVYSRLFFPELLAVEKSLRRGAFLEFLNLMDAY